MAKQSQTTKSGAPGKSTSRSDSPRAASARSASRANAQRGRRNRGRSNNAILLWVIGGVIVLVAGILLLNQRQFSGGGGGAAHVSAGSAWGPVDAPVKIVEYSNFGCSHCRNFALDAGQKLRQEYGAGGKVRFEFKQFKLGDPSTTDAANASLCAADQSRFWDYHDLLFQKQGISATAFSKGSLKAYAKQLNLDSTTFDTCVDKSQFMATVNQDSQDGVNLGVNGTPTFFINGEQSVGDQPYDQLKAKVDAAIAAKS